jgi:hypothetical protein
VAGWAKEGNTGYIPAFDCCSYSLHSDFIVDAPRDDGDHPYGYKVLEGQDFDGSFDAGSCLCSVIVGGLPLFFSEGYDWNMGRL